MSERRVEVPKWMPGAVADAFPWTRPAVAQAHAIAEEICRHLVANPQTPTDEQCDMIAAETWAPNREVVRNIVKIYMIRFLFAPAEPADPLADALLEMFPCGYNEAQRDIAEAFYKRGQQSMIKKENQP